MVLAEIKIAEGANDDAGESLDRSIDLFEQLGLIRQAIHPRLLRVLMLLESASVELARAELARLFSEPEIDAPWITTLLTGCLGLAFDVDKDAADFNAAVEEVSALIDETEVLPPDIMRCLQLAIERALQMGYPERASLIRKLGIDAGTDSGVGK